MRKYVTAWIGTPEGGHWAKVPQVKFNEDQVGPGNHLKNAAGKETLAPRPDGIIAQDGEDWRPVETALSHLDNWTPRKK